MAKSSIILMNRLSRGIDDNSHFMLDNVCIQQNSRNFTVRMYLGSTEEEMGRFGYRFVYMIPCYTYNNI